MGRPPLHLKPVPVRLSQETLDRIAALVGKYKRPEFIREAIERELERRENERGESAV
ncbi:hypothetical protein [Sphingomonas zeae]|jgi:predicted DNA-binding protein|uniref:hypothetical protein n=2 Tax=Sphingomonas TaxID=13687 RepID=UPI00255140EB|nr:hypothetical protein [Sphingomonas zeae]MDK8187838.1 hypothetical protein [Sphingomonas zeae]